MAEKEQLLWIDVNLIDEPSILLHPNPDLAGLEELARSIQEQGQLQPIVVRPKGDRYEIVFGYRRYLACKKFGIPKVWAKISYMNDKSALIASAVENIQRSDQDVVAEGELFRRLIYEQGVDPHELATKLGKSIGYINSRIDLLGMPPAVQDLCKLKKLQLGVIPELKKIDLDEDKILVASDLARRGYTVEGAKHVIQAFIKYKKQMLEEKPEEVLEKAKEEPLAMCQWCKSDKKVRFLGS